MCVYIIMYLCVLDFEATCDGNVKNFDNEIIEFPSILLKWENNKMSYISEFQAFVQPRDNPILTQFCVNLTKITQDLINNAESFPVVYARHLAWLHSHVDDFDEMVFITCGHWDLRKMIKMEAKRWNVDLHPIYTKYINIKEEFERHYNKKFKSMVAMLEYQGLTHKGILHSGIDDCRNITKILLKMIEDGHDVSNFTVVF
jgi:inhibitor of KinA sporulation pathway (predicted exonuclease)